VPLLYFAAFAVADKPEVERDQVSAGHDLAAHCEIGRVFAAVVADDH
jgi:hypothetical protein